MRSRTLLAISLLALSPGLLWLAACGGGDSSSGGDGGPDGSMNADSGGGMDSGSMDSGNMDSGNGMDSGGMDGGGGNCAEAGTGGACRACCRNAHMSGYQAYEMALHTCACTAQVCQTQCMTTFCANMPSNPNMQCSGCLTSSLRQDGGACFGAVATACTQNADCTAMLQCLGTCP